MPTAPSYIVQPTAMCIRATLTVLLTTHCTTLGRLLKIIRVALCSCSATTKTIVMSTRAMCITANLALGMTHHPHVSHAPSPSTSPPRLQCV
mmetsp:Transcript_70262/g.117888  ORF Transcript_70262/g.117888 Transcript_70262/m.117888 type:complete len:92 (-) Transcript_70262:1814-2089(-)